MKDIIHKRPPTMYIDTEAYFGDIVSLLPDHSNKENIAIKQVT